MTYDDPYAGLNAAQRAARQADDSYWIRRDRERSLSRLTPVQRQNNPEGKPMGHFTGRCYKCGSSDLWDDNLHYGCNNCKVFLA